VRTATAARLLLGSAWVLAPQASLRLAGAQDRGQDHVVALTRVLGARLVIQGTADLILGPRVRRLDLAVELAHAVSMLPVAVRWPLHRRTALVSAGVAATVAALDFSDV
jgi:hypothetical protein